MTDEEQKSEERTGALAAWVREEKAVWTDADKTLRHPDGRFVRAATFEDAAERMQTHEHHLTVKEPA